MSHGNHKNPYEHMFVNTGRGNVLCLMSNMNQGLHGLCLDLLWIQCTVPTIFITMLLLRFA